MTQSGVADRCAELTGVLWWEEMRSVKSVEVWEERNAKQEGRWKCHGGQIQPVPSITHIPSALALVCHFVSISLLVHKRFLRLKTKVLHWLFSVSEKVLYWVGITWLPRKWTKIAFFCLENFYFLFMNCTFPLRCALVKSNLGFLSLSVTSGSCGNPLFLHSWSHL